MTAAHPVLCKRPGYGAAPRRADGFHQGSAVTFAIQWAGMAAGQDAILFPAVGMADGWQRASLSRVGHSLKGGDFAPAKYDPALDGMDRRRGGNDIPLPTGHIHQTKQNIAYIRNIVTYAMFRIIVKNRHSHKRFIDIQSTVRFHKTIAAQGKCDTERTILWKIR